jgi:hypothetical protein
MPRDLSPLLTRGLTEQLLRAPAVTEVVCPDCRELVPVNGAGWIRHREACNPEPMNARTSA